MTDRIEDKLTTDQQQVMSRLSKTQLVRLAWYTRRLYNNLCPGCKAVALNNPQTFQSYESLCNTCKHNENIINVFSGLQELNSEIKS